MIKNYKELNNYDNYDSFNLIESILDNNYNNLLGWKFPKDNGVWHITTYYAAKIDQKTRESNEAYKEFSEGKCVDIYFDGFVYVPGNLMTAYTTSNKFFCNNKV